MKHFSPFELRLGREPAEDIPLTAPNGTQTIRLNESSLHDQFSLFEDYSCTTYTAKLFSSCSTLLSAMYTTKLFSI